MSPAGPGAITVLLDLDGTLVDPGPGIIGAYRHAMHALGCPVDSADDLRWVIGPSPRATFATLLAGRADPETALALYRAKYGDTGLFEASVYDGVFDALEALKRAGNTLMVCTAKARVFADRIVRHFGLAPYVSAVYGPDLDGRLEDKGDLIAHILDVEHLAPRDACMVGDRRHDITAARRHGMASIGVLWGYGSEAELRAAGATRLIGAPTQLPSACKAVGEAPV